LNLTFILDMVSRVQPIACEVTL